MKSHLCISVEKAKDALKFGIEEGRLHRKGKLVVTNKIHIENSSPLACCFIKDPDNILMWSHYADHHKGVCLSFKAKHRPKTAEFRYTTKYRLTIDSVETPLFSVNYDIKSQVV